MKNKLKKLRDSFSGLNKTKKNQVVISIAILVIGVGTLIIASAATKSINLDLSTAKLFNESGKVSYSAGTINFDTNPTPPLTTYNINDWLQTASIPDYNPPEGSFPTGGIGNFRFACWPSHINYDDPIVSPGDQGAAHLHMFFGNRNLNYQTNTDNITKSGDGSCDGGPLNRTGYWIPAMLDSKDKVRLPFSVIFYYKTAGLDKNTMTPYPTGLRMISGNANANTPQNDWRRVFVCYKDAPGSTDGSNLVNYYPNDQKFATIPNCPVGNYLKLGFAFPQCGKRNNDGTPVLDSVDHKSHMSDQMDSGYKCPPDFPIAYPEVSLNMIWKITDNPTDNWYLASDRMNGANKDGGTTLHADWMMGWDTTIMETFINRCLKEGRNVNGADGNLCNGKKLKQLNNGIDARRYTGPQVVDKPASLKSQVNFNSPF